jgi:molybdopterin converting factor small subunit
MKIEIHLFASLYKYLPPGAVDKAFIMEVGQGALIKDILQQIGVPRGEVKLIFLNGIHARETDVLKDGDRLGFFPPIGGG